MSLTGAVNCSVRILAEPLICQEGEAVPPGAPSGWRGKVRPVPVATVRGQAPALSFPFSSVRCSLYILRLCYQVYK